ncbi:mucin [Cryptosporidium sp. chipmunk genotype I]|nr:mucin [Cryptosporidium sp. chipmunk genotype I]
MKYLYLVIFCLFTLYFSLTHPVSYGFSFHRAITTVSLLKLKTLPRPSQVSKPLSGTGNNGDKKSVTGRVGSKPPQGTGTSRSSTSLLSGTRGSSVGSSATKPGGASSPNVSTPTNPEGSEDSSQNTTTSPKTEGTPSPSLLSKPGSGSSSTKTTPQKTPLSSRVGSSTPGSAPKTVPRPSGLGTSSTRPSGLGTSSTRPSGLGTSSTRPSGPGTAPKPSAPGVTQKPLGPGTSTKPSGPRTPSKPLGPGSTLKPLETGLTPNPSGLGVTKKPLGPGTAPKPTGPKTLTRSSGSGTTPKPGSTSTPRRSLATGLALSSSGLGTLTRPSGPGAIPKSSPTKSTKPPKPSDLSKGPLSKTKSMVSSSARIVTSVKSRTRSRSRSRSRSRERRKDEHRHVGSADPGCTGETEGKGGSCEGHSSGGASGGSSDIGRTGGSSESGGASGCSGSVGGGGGGGSGGVGGSDGSGGDRDKHSRKVRYGISPETDSDSDSDSDSESDSEIFNAVEEANVLSISKMCRDVISSLTSPSASLTFEKLKSSGLLQVQGYLDRWNKILLMLEEKLKSLIRKFSSFDCSNSEVRESHKMNKICKKLEEKINDLETSIYLTKKKIKKLKKCLEKIERVESEEEAHHKSKKRHKTKRSRSDLGFKHEDSKSDTEGSDTEKPYSGEKFPQRRSRRGRGGTTVTSFDESLLGAVGGQRREQPPLQSESSGSTSSLDSTTSSSSSGSCSVPMFNGKPISPEILQFEIEISQKYCATLLETLRNGDDIESVNAVEQFRSTYLAMKSIVAETPDKIERVQQIVQGFPPPEKCDQKSKRELQSFQARIQSLNFRAEVFEKKLSVLENCILSVLDIITENELGFLLPYLQTILESGVESKEESETDTQEGLFEFDSEDFGDETDNGLRKDDGNGESKTDRTE